MCLHLYDIVLIQTGWRFVSDADKQRFGACLYLADGSIVSGCFGGGCAFCFV